MQQQLSLSVKKNNMVKQIFSSILVKKDGKWEHTLSIKKDQYDELLNRVRALQNEQPTNTQTRKRGRPAKRQSKKQTTSNTTSTKESKEVDKETQ